MILYGLGGLLLLLQYPLWFGSGGLVAQWQLREEIETQKAENAQLRERNETLAAEVADLKSGHEALEERARRELGMVKKSESFYQVVERRPVRSP
ncbi:MAG: cell division protein FtsB [Pseudomonadota bacterium]|nr:MAG: cell division protein FtsB [Pseudomonadota bacterium]